jgi:cold shock CspA family protein
VAKFLAGDNCGFIETADGREVFFHRNSVLDEAFDRLTVGSEVRFVEEMGEKGPQASTVRLIGKHHLQ